MLVHSVTPVISPQDVKGKKGIFCKMGQSEFFPTPQEMMQSQWLQESPITAFSV